MQGTFLSFTSGFSEIYLLNFSLMKNAENRAHISVHLKTSDAPLYTKCNTKNCKYEVTAKQHRSIKFRIVLKICISQHSDTNITAKELTLF